jgi:tRNA (adenine57-N1/adenine58-N1)-methyltransferase
MRQLGWVDIEMVELSQKRFEIRRERIGIDNGAQRGLQSTPASVDEAVTRLLEVEGAFKSFHQDGFKVEGRSKSKDNPNSREKIVESLVDKKIYKEGRLVHRTEPEVKTHTSYLVFAVLPVEWSDEDEAKARSQWEVLIRREDEHVGREAVKMSKRQMKRAESQSKKDKAATSAERKPESIASASGGKKDERSTADTGAKKEEVEHTNAVDPESMNTNE